MTPIEILLLGELNSIFDAMVMAKNLSSGTYKTKVLEKPIDKGGWGRPYGIKGKVGRRTPPPYPNLQIMGLPAKINKQTGTFLASWNFDYPRQVGDSIVSGIFNNAPYADELAEGTLLQMARPLPDLVAYQLGKRQRVKNLIEAIVSSGDLGIQVRY